MAVADQTTAALLNSVLTVSEINKVAVTITACTEPYRKSVFWLSCAVDSSALPPFDTVIIAYKRQLVKAKFSAGQKRGLLLVFGCEALNKLKYFGYCVNVLGIEVYTRIFKQLSEAHIWNPFPCFFQLVEASINSPRISHIIPSMVMLLGNNCPYILRYRYVPRPT